MRRLRTWLQNLALGALGVGLAVVLAEGLARVVWSEPPVATAPAELPAGLEEIRGMRAVLRPNVRAIHKGVLFETNSAGFRDREYPKQKPPGTTRIVLVGDSFTMAQGVAIEHSYANRLEEMLADHPGGPYEVLNLGVSGFAINQVFNRMVRLGAAYDPDLVVYGLTLNDIDGPRYRDLIHRFSFIQQRVRYERFRESRSHLLRLAWPRLQSLRELLDPPPDSYLNELLVNYAEDSPAWADFVRAIERFGRTQERLQLPIVVFIHSQLFYLNMFHPFSGIYDQVGREAERAGLRVIQTFPAFLGEDPRAVWVAQHDFHPNSRGHEILAEALYAGLIELAAGDQDRWPVPMPPLGTGRPGQ